MSKEKPELYPTSFSGKRKKKYKRTIIQYSGNNYYPEDYQKQGKKETNTLVFGDYLTMCKEFIAQKYRLLKLKEMRELIEKGIFVFPPYAEELSFLKKYQDKYQGILKLQEEYEKANVIGKFFFRRKHDDIILLFKDIMEHDFHCKPARADGSSELQPKDSDISWLTRTQLQTLFAELSRVARHALLPDAIGPISKDGLTYVRHHGYFMSVAEFYLLQPRKDISYMAFVLVDGETLTEESSSKKSPVFQKREGILFKRLNARNGKTLFIEWNDIREYKDDETFPLAPHVIDERKIGKVVGQDIFINPCQEVAFIPNIGGTLADSDYLLINHLGSYSQEENKNE